MADGARSDHPPLQTQLDRLAALSPGSDVLGLGRIKRLLARLGNPHEGLPPVFHVAGTNGKGSTCAYLRACLEAAGHRSEEHTSELQSLLRISYAVFCLKKKTKMHHNTY